MKTTLDIRDDLLEEIQARAQAQHRSLDEVVAELLSTAIKSEAASKPFRSGQPLIQTDLQNGSKGLSPEDLKEILEQEDLQRFYDSTR